MGYHGRGRETSPLNPIPVCITVSQDLPSLVWGAWLCGPDPELQQSCQSPWGFSKVNWLAEQSHHPLYGV